MSSLSDEMACLTDLIIVDRESVRSDGLKEHVVNAQAKIVTVPMGLDLQKFSPSKSGPGNSHAGFRFNTALGIALTRSRLAAVSHPTGAM
jgi:hypothetical protein